MLTQNLLDPRVRRAAHVNKNVAFGDLHDILHARLIAVHIHAVFEKKLKRKRVVFSDNFPRPIVEGKNTA